MIKREGNADVARDKEGKKKDAKALYLIQQAVNRDLFPRLMSATTAKEAWNILQKEFKGDDRVIAIKLQTLRREFEVSMMRGGETVQEYLSRMFTLVSQMRSFGEKVEDKVIVAKVLRSMTIKFDHVVAAIEESKDLDKFTFDQL